MYKLPAIVCTAVMFLGCGEDVALVDPTPTTPTSVLTEPVHSQPTGALLGWWAGDGDAMDAVGANHGAPVGTVGYAKGKHGEAFEFSGEGFVSIPDHPSLDLGDELTLSFWFKYDAVPSRFSRGLIGKREGATGSARSNFGANVSDNAQSGLASYFSEGTGFKFTGLAPAPVATSFRHFVGTFRTIDSGHVELTIHLDGIRTQQVTVDGSLQGAPNDAPMTIGASWANRPNPTRPQNGELFEGVIDEVMLYNCALDAEGVAALFDGEVPTECGHGPSALDVLDELRAAVQALADAGMLNKGQANSLLKKVDFAIARVDGSKGDLSDAISKLGAFVNEVTAFTKAGILTTNDADILVGLAHLATDIIEAQANPI